MGTLALRSVRQRPGRFLATLLAAFLGSVVTMTFNSLHDTAAGAHVDDRSAETLTVSASVVGGYGTLLVLLAVASTLTVNVRQRGEEMKLLRCTGATPAQITRMVVGEAVLVAVAGVLLAIAPAAAAGRLLLEMFQDSGQVAAGVDHAFGPVALSSGIAVTVLASAGAAWLAVRRAAKSAAGGKAPRRGRRTAVGLLAVLLGTGAILSTYGMEPSEPALMAGPAYGAILLAAGLAALAPLLLRAVLGAVARPVTALGGAGTYLAVHNLRQRAEQLAGILMPMILFVGMAAATLSMQSVETDAIAASGRVKSVDDKTLQTLNLTIVGVIVVFACLMLINTLYAETSYRRREFGQQRLAGATPRQVLAGVGAEGVALAMTGVVLGSAAAFAGASVFHQVRTEDVSGVELLGTGVPLWLLVAATAVTATLGTTLLTARRALAVPAVDAVAVTA